MKRRKLRNLEVSSIGLGCMGFSQSYPPFIPKRRSYWCYQKSCWIGGNIFWYGGRTGIVLQAGFRWNIGKDPSKNKVEKITQIKIKKLLNH